MTRVFSLPRMRGLAGLVAVLFFVTAMNAETPSGSTGIEGAITTGPMHGGPSRKGETDSAPVAGVNFEVTNDTGIVAAFTTDANGAFSVAVPPGHYLVRRAGTKPKLGGCGQFTVDVSAGSIAKVHFECDSGIR